MNLSSLCCPSSYYVTGYPSPTTFKIRRPKTKHGEDKESDERHLLASDSVNIGDDEVVPGDVLELGHLKYSSKASAAVSY